ncbi:MAG TPA: YdeI/OmpD-associated family protein [Panacibacter sp.]|nr:YdeI/OmpD-associated family protein [Panacibacter sp.]
MGNNTGINVPEEIIEKLGAGKKPPVVVTLNKYTYRNTVAVMGGKYMISLSAENRKNANAKGGDELEITLSLDTEPRTVELPADFQEALDKNKQAKTIFEKLSPGKKKAIVVSINDAKTEETKRKRIDKTITSLTEGKV